ncbi:MAG: S1 RNA-binding domain-containing protein [Clostridia bacterium]|nr:S1 RNA-binding domain-containing protein [Clostridia bacterium]
MFKTDSMQPKIINVTCIGYDKSEGMFTVKLPDSRTGKIPKDEMSIYPLKNDKQIESFIGKDIRVAIIDESDMTLSGKIPMQKQLEKLTEENPVGKILKVTVVSASDVALYCDLGEGISGIIYRNDIISTPFPLPTDVYPIGSVIDAKVKNFKADKSFFTLSHRDVFSRSMKAYRKGMHLNGIIREQIKRGNVVTGYFVEVTPAIKGILDINDSIYLQNGEKIPMVVNDITPKGLKLRLEYPN